MGARLRPNVRDKSESDVSAASRSPPDAGRAHRAQSCSSAKRSNSSGSWTFESDVESGYVGGASQGSSRKSTLQSGGSSIDGDGVQAGGWAVETETHAVEECFDNPQDADHQCLDVLIPRDHFLAWL